MIYNRFGKGLRMYQVNETIFYGSEGVCRIADISERRFDDKTIEYFVLKPVFQNKALYMSETTKLKKECDMSSTQMRFRNY